MQLGNLSLKNNLFLAPMAGITDLPFRSLLREFGCSFAFTEMISATGLVRKSAKSLCYMRSCPDDRLLGAQLFGTDPLVLAEGARIVAGLGADTVDINMGCPAKKVVKMGAGAALLKNPLHVAHIIEAVRRAVALPLTVKIRSGWNRREIRAVEIARIAEECGADGVIVHPRTADQGFGGQADWDIIGAVKASIAIPVIGNGDVRDAGDALRLMKTTGCAGVMVGRATFGNPWLFGEIAARLSGGDGLPFPSLGEKERVMARHLDRSVAYYGEAAGSRNFRKHLLWYTKGLPGGAVFRNLAGALEGKEAILGELRRFFSQVQEHVAAGNS